VYSPSATQLLEKISWIKKITMKRWWWVVLIYLFKNWKSIFIMNVLASDWGVINEKIFIQHNDFAYNYKFYDL